MDLKEQVKNHATIVLHNIDPYLSVILCDWTTIYIDTDAHPPELQDYTGWYEHNSKQIIIQDEYILSTLLQSEHTKFLETAKQLSITTHELFHAIQDVYGFLLDGQEWEDNNIHNLSTPVEQTANFKQDLLSLWDHRDDMELYRESQTKNPNELAAISFERYIHLPEDLQQKQPNMYRFMEEYIGNFSVTTEEPIIR